MDTLGLVLRVKVHAANLQDRAAVPLLLHGAAALFPWLAHVCVDQGYTGSGKMWIDHGLGWTVTVVQHPPKARGEWRPIGDLNDLWLCETSEALIYVAMSRLMLRRLARASPF